MKFVIRSMIVLLGMLTVAGAEKKPQTQPTFAIEDSGGLLQNPMSSEDFERYQQGKLPRIVTIFPSESSIFASGFVDYLEKGNENNERLNNWHRTAPKVALISSLDGKISLAANLRLRSALGMRLVRGEDEKILQACTLTDVYFFSEEKSKITVERYLERDCTTNQDGLMAPRPGIKWKFREEFWENPKEHTSHSRVIYCKYQYSDGSPDKNFVVTISESAGRSENSFEIYRGKPGIPENLVERNMMQRVMWPEGPGYRQIKKIEVAKENGPGIKLKTHVMESWRVDKTGFRTLVKSENLIVPEQQQIDPKQTF